MLGPLISDPSTNRLREGAPRAGCIEARGCITRKLPLPLPRSRTSSPNSVSLAVVVCGAMFSFAAGITPGNQAGFMIQ